MNTMQYGIREAQLSDLPGILPLLVELGYPCGLECLTQRFQRFLKNPGYGLAVAEAQGATVGWVAWSQSDLFVSEGVRFHIEGLVVSPRCRRQGIGKHLMAFVEAQARSHSPAIIDLTSGVHRASGGTHAFYQELGYQNEGILAKVYLRKTF